MEEGPVDVLVVEPLFVPLAPAVGVLGGNEVIECWPVDETPVPVEVDEGAVSVSVVAESVPVNGSVETWGLSITTIIYIERK